jgi:hypothetical protein
MVSALAKGWIPEGFFPTSPGGMKPFLDQGKYWLEKIDLVECRKD